jgi:hypothetical protein
VTTALSPASIALACGLLAACSSGTVEPPVVNPDAARLLRVHGVVDPSLTIRVHTQYLSTQDQCRVENAAGRPAPRSQWVESDITRSGDEYEAMVAVDHFQEDACGWRPFVIGFQVTDAQGVTTGRFSPGPDAQLVPGPENKVWISMPGQRESTGEISQRRGSRAIRPLDLYCAPIIVREARALSCVTDSPRELPLLSDDALEVTVNFRPMPAVQRRQ